MKERPILFSGAMVQAILSGNKTQTRRVVKKQNALNALELFGPTFLTLPGNVDMCPYGVPGDRLWVRETTYSPLIGQSHVMQVNEGMVYAADRPTRPAHYKTVPSTHMPRWASRITLEVVSVRVERLQDISEEDAMAEGASATRWFQPAGKPEGDSTNLAASGEKWNETWDNISYRNGFATLWESINGSGSWEANPWVWVISFRSLPTEGEAR